jgi:hypothetical protein
MNIKIGCKYIYNEYKEKVKIINIDNNIEVEVIYSETASKDDRLFMSETFFRKHYKLCRIEKNHFNKNFSE